MKPSSLERTFELFRQKLKFINRFESKDRFENDFELPHLFSAMECHEFFGNRALESA